MRKNLAVLVIMLTLVPGLAVCAEERYSPKVRQILDASYSRKDQSGIIQSLTQGAAKAATPTDQKAILASLADYEERSGLTADAAKHYGEAAFADPSRRDDRYILDEARCSLVSGDTVGADGLTRAVLLTCFDPEVLLRARVYAAWIQLSSGDTAGALPLIRSYTENSAFASYEPALLFTLWWAGGDEPARKKLLGAWPASPEAAILRGEMRLAAAPFWYLMGRNETQVSSFAREGAAAIAASVSTSDAAPNAGADTGSGASTGANADTGSGAGTGAGMALSPDSTAKEVPPSRQPQSAPPASPLTQTVAVKPAPAAPSSGVWQQTGFFKNREYADELKEKLRKTGFSATIREEMRPSGTVYYSVLVPENAERTTGDRLKDAGFESCLVDD